MVKHNICPWWVGYFLISPIRRWMQDPEALLKPYVREGMTVLEPGPGMGFFTLPLARLVGSSGRVIALDVEPRMIAALKRRATRAGVFTRIDARVVPAQSMELGASSVDFVFAGYVVHEMPAASQFFNEAAQAMKHGAALLLIEPAGHVGEAEFAGELAAAKASGLKAIDRPSIKHCLAAVLQKP